MYNKETQDQIAKVMLLHGTPKQQQEVLDYCSFPVVIKDDIDDTIDVEYVEYVKSIEGNI